MTPEAPLWLVWLVAFAQGLAFGVWLGVYIARDISPWPRRARAKH